jgi:hypothetical protein
VQPRRTETNGLRPVPRVESWLLGRGGSMAAATLLGTGGEVVGPPEHVLASIVEARTKK